MPAQGVGAQQVGGRAAGREALDGRELRAVVTDRIVEWHPDSQAAVVTLATAEQLPGEIKTMLLKRARE